MPVVGFIASIFWSIFASHFGRVTFPVLGSYSIKLCLLRSVRIVCSFSVGISKCLASCLMFFGAFSSIIVSKSAVVGIGLNECMRFIKG